MINKKVIKIIVIIAVIISILLFLRFIVGGPEDDWICKDGQWIKHGAPNSPMPTKSCN